ncbi:hypothetical protein A2U01_0045860, partial [Trifolium medium]|nr:hypothetical protein [Trifolium medium]
TEYTPLNTSREKILHECINAEFDHADIRFPREIKESSRTDKTKYCRFHRSHKHEIQECIQLKDAIEDLIKQGKLNRFHMSHIHDTEECIQLKDAIEDLIKQGKLNRYTKDVDRYGRDKRRRDSP